MKRVALGGRMVSAAGNMSGRGLRLALFAGVSCLTIASLALANPQGGEVVQGGATISTPNTTTTKVDQSTDKAVINWKSFNVGEGESTIFNQPNASSVTLNRIFDQNPSVIAGLVSANGRLILINANGMVFENGASVNTAGLIATTADISNNDFMAGNYRFETPGAANASIVNKGVITADEGGVVAFVAPSVRNSGVITAKLGQVSLGAGNTFVLDLYGDNLISFPVSAEIAQQLVGPDGKPLTALVEAGGKIEAGSVQLTARAARGIIDNVINVDGEIIASGVRQAGGSTFLTGSGGSGTTQDDRSSATADAIVGGNGGGVQGAYGGRIVIDGGENNVNLAGSLSASGTTGAGAISVTGNNVYAGGSTEANGGSGQGGSVAINANNFASLTGSISANGASGGSVNVTSGQNLLTAGTISANGTTGAGGSVSLTAANHHIATQATQVSANGATGGSISVSGGTGSDALGLFSSGSYSAHGSTGEGGQVAIGGREINLIDAKVDASGATGGGTVAVGFIGSGSSRSINADTIRVSPTSTLNADAITSGDGGSVIFWSNLTSDFMGTITARGGSLGGNGGFLEVSSKGEVGFWGLGDASAANGEAGQLSLDPKNIVIDDAGGMIPSYELIDSGTGATSFGATLITLANGNVAVTSTSNDTVANNAGAVFLFSTSTGALISMTTGTRADDAIGSGGLTALASGNFLITSQNWDNGAGAVDAGAVTYVNGTTGLAGQVSAANSLVGGAANMNVGSGGITLLTNGNYVVASPNWDNGGTANVGAVTLGNGAGGTVGTVTTGNSLAGSQTTDSVGSGGVVALSNGNYVVRSMLWNNGGTADAGAVTWRSGTNFTGTAVAAGNSFVGSNANDQVGANGVVALNNGNYVVASSLWNNGGTTDAGAVTWGNGTNGSLMGGGFGALSAANSFVGTGTNNNVGSGGVVALSNGNYVAISQNWDNGGTANVGAVTLGNGATGTAGNVGTGNSLVGSTADDLVGNGGVVALTNGNYVVASLNWDANGGGANDDHGAITWRSGTNFVGTTVASGNSFVGSSDNDNVGSNGIVALNNGNYVVSSSVWNNGGTADAGAVTWGNGTNGQFMGGGFGALGAANSLVGTATNNNVGSSGAVALSNGNYVAVSPNWDNGGTTNVGAVTWGNGATGTAGNVGTGNSLVGTTANDNVGSGGVTALTNGHYVVASPSWTNGGDTDTGAVTWRNGTGVNATTVTAANSLIGSEDNDNVGSGGVVALANGDYVVSSPFADFGSDGDAGAVTLGSGTSGVTGNVSATNSFIGDDDDDEFRFAGQTANGDILIRNTNDGEVFVGLTDPNQLTFAHAQGQTLTVNPAFLTRTLNTGTAVSLQASNDLTVADAINVNNPGGNGGALTLQAGRSVLINADINTDNGNLTIIANELLANGVINAQRDAGSAVITMASGTDIVAGTGNVVLRIASGAGKTNLTSGDMTLRNVSGATILAENLGTTAGSDMILASGGGAVGLNATGAGTPLVLASQVGNFVNQIGAGSLQSPNGRWLVYSQTPTANTLGGLAGTSWYNAPYNPANPTGLAATGNRFAYTIAPTLTVTANNQSREYGEPNAGLTYAITGLLGSDTLGGAVQGTPDLQTTATQTSSVAGGPYAITASMGTLSSAYNYGFTMGAPAALTISPAQLFYTADPKSREYGDPNGLIIGTLTGLKNGEAVGDVTDGTLSFASVADNFSNIGTYDITGGGLSVTSGNYQINILQSASNANALTVTPAQLYYLAEQKVRTYGDTDGSVDGQIAGLKNGASLGDVAEGGYSFTTTVNSNTGAGVYGILGSGLTVIDPNYAPVVLQAATNATAYTVNQAQLFYSANTEQREYGDANPLFSGTIEGFVSDDTAASVVSGALVFSSSTTQSSNVGSHAINGSGLTVIDPNYALTILQDPGNQTALTITPAQLTYIANAAIRIYGDANPTFTGEVSGLKNGDSLETITSGTLAFTSVATPTSNVGVYDIVGGGLTVTSGNYLLTIQQDGDNTDALQIIQAKLFYAAAPKSITYGDALPTLTGVVEGIRNGETLESIAFGSLIWRTTADNGDDVGAYAIEGDGLVVINPNYDSDIQQRPTNDIALIINPAQLTYVADPKSQLYGLPAPALTGNLVGMRNGDGFDDVVSGTLGFTSAATPFSPAGIYAVNGSGLTVTNTNYIVNIQQAPANATAYEIRAIPDTVFQAKVDGTKTPESATDQAQNDMSSRSNELGIVGVNPVVDDMQDGKNDELPDQLCVLGAPEAANAPGCVARKQGK